MIGLKTPAYSFVFSVLMLCAVGWSGSRSPQQSAPAAQLPPISAQDLVRRTVDHELAASKTEDSHYMFKDRRQTPAGSKTKLMIETRQGAVAYLVAINDKSLTAEQRQQETQRLQNLLSSPEEQSRKKKAQDADNERVAKMFRDLPSAFKYTYDGVIPGNGGREWVRLKFEPNPSFNPSSRESSVFKAMNGTLIVDPQAERMVKIEATLFKDVSFGWGILGRLDKGGHFIVEQTNIGDNRWEPTYMNIQFTGKALLFKTIDLRQIETTSDYTRVADNLSLSQGVDMLKKRVDALVAENKTTK